MTSPELDNPIDVLEIHPPMSPNLTDAIDVVKALLIDSNNNSTVKYGSNLVPSVKQSTTLRFKLGQKCKKHALRENISLPRVKLCDESSVLNDTEETQRNTQDENSKTVHNTIVASK